MANAFELSAVSGAIFMGIGKASGAGALLKFARHNKREIQAELGAATRIDASRCNLNYSLSGPNTAQGIAELAKRLMLDAGVKSVRKDCVRAIEILFSLPIGFAGDQRGFFTACLNWCSSRFGGAENVLSFDIHLDEAAIHAHCLLLPLIEGKMRGSDMVGGRQVLAGHQESFHREVASRFGLSRALKQVRGNQKANLSDSVFDHMKRTNDAALSSPVWQSIRAAIKLNPVPFVQAYGLVIESQPKKSKTFVQIMTAPVKPESSKRGNSNPIGFDEVAVQKEQTLSCVGFGISTATISVPIVGEYSRIREDSIPIQNYDSGCGEFKQLPKQSGRKASGFWVVGDSTVLSKRSTPHLEQAQRVFKGQTVTTLDEKEIGQCLETLYKPNVMRMTKWGMPFI
jgi:Plasmid recombination enzyme